MSIDTLRMNLLQRLNAVRKAVKYIQKDKSVSTGGTGSYKAVTHDLVTAMTRDLLTEHGVLSFPSLVTSKMSPPVKADGKQWLYEATYDFEFCNMDDPADTKTVRIEAHANDNSDKAPGKALSYAKKYAILKILDIETGEDDESRVKDEFDIAPHIEAMEACKTLDELKAAYSAAEKAAKDSGDKGAFNAILGAKNRIGAAITKALPMSDKRFQACLNMVTAGTATLEAFSAYTLTDKQQSIIADMKADQE